jgi:hypothetical protein
VISLYSKRDKLFERGVGVKTMKEQKAAPVKPYDDSMWDRNSMYDTMPYAWDRDINIDKRFTRESGNIIKFYRCQIKEPYEVKHE